MDDRLLTLEEVAEHLGISTQTMYQWRAAAPPRGPKAIKFGRVVRVRESELLTWLDSQSEAVA